MVYGDQNAVSEARKATIAGPSETFQTVSRDCLENTLKGLDGLCLLASRERVGTFSPLLATRYTPNRGLSGLSRQSLYEVR
jgi:hypothetical protein